MNRKGHWDLVYGRKADEEVSWRQTEPQPSLQLILGTPRGNGRVIDVGGGSSVLVDRLIGLPFSRVAVLDISPVAMNRSRARLGESAIRVEWIEADVTAVDDLGQFDMWHDRAVFHFLTESSDRERYVGLARRTLPVAGHLIVGTFATDGPTKCSGLDVCRYDADSLAEQFREGFTLVRGLGYTHTTPWGTPQSFFYGVLRRS
jgi:hypothetical protein